MGFDGALSPRPVSPFINGEYLKKASRPDFHESLIVASNLRPPRSADLSATDPSPVLRDRVKSYQDLRPPSSPPLDKGGLEGGGAGDDG